MKITYIHQHFKRPTEAGGTRSWEFARRLVADGHDVTMICGGATRDTYVEEGFTVVQLPVRYANVMAPWRRLVAFARFMVMATTASFKDKADVVLATSTPLTVAVPALVTTFARRSTFVLEVRDLWPEVPVQLGYLRSRPIVKAAEYLERLSYKRARRVIALSPGMADGVKRISPAKRVDIVPNACDIELFDRSPSERQQFRAEQGWGSDESVVVYAGSLGAYYDIPWVGRFAVACRAQGIRMLVIGEGAGLRAARQSLEAQGIAPDDVFIGPRPKREVAGFVSAADAVVSSLAPDPVLEPCSLNKVFDGLAASRPVVMNHGGWLKELLCAEGAGIHVGGLQPDEAASRLSALLEDRERYERAVRQSRALAASHFARDDLYRDFRTAVTGAGDVVGAFDAGHGRTAEYASTAGETSP
ncbi:glycosyltransferase family 4 protein [Terracoccus luteus]|uniref:Glycosyltransferase involved in cell wall biosynthesis n=1 Tax=Terracoccus luteus TaxID=53356 RepID=A0A839PMT6_9MICO|nr:glycosyltransferase family 4 protein [Terracoccus luteus]MBB2985550.1 glycosyltransferase involved in cell wall biosynthesis [Terracoccus luteus]MCP2171202.1 glycosyltransferase involved in cell wall biosynthesis [Terracoccus luteus]